MLAKLTLSLEHASWLEAVRKIPCEIAAQAGVVSSGTNLAFEYRRNGQCVFRKIRKEVLTEDGRSSKTFWIDPPPSQLETGLFLWNEDCLSEPCASDVPLIITEGECFPGETEVLTEQGWCALADYRGGPVVQAHESGGLSWAVPLAKVEKHYRGNLVRYAGRFLSVITTPGHNVVAVREGRWVKQRADEVFAHGLLPRSGVMADGPGIGLSLDQIIVCLAVSADAAIDVRKQAYAGRPARNIARESRYARISFSKSRKAVRLRAALTACAISFYESATDVGGKPGTFFGISLPNWVPGCLLPWRWLVDATIAEREDLISELRHWDGNGVPNRNQEEFSTRHRELADWVQALCHLTGRCSTIIARENEWGKWFKVSILHGKTHGSWQMAKRGSELVPFDGTVHCLTMPSGYLVVRQEGRVHISGNCDALSFLAAGATHVVSVPNGNTEKAGSGDINPLEDNQFKYLWDGVKLSADIARFNKIILATDDDKVGRILRDELAVRLGRPKCWYVNYPEGCKDANEVLAEYGVDAVSDLIADAKPIVPDKLVPFSEIPSRSDAARYGTGWPGFDDHFMLAPPQLVVVTGKPNAGKSQWIIALAANWARLYGLKGAILQFEDDPDRNRRDLLRYAKAWHNQQGGIQEDPQAWVDRMFRAISPNEDADDDNDYDLAWLRSTIEEAATRHGVKWIIIDPWNEVEHLWGRQDTEATYLNRALKQLKRMARRYQIAIIIVTHPTKEGANRTSVEDFTLSDINGGQTWSNKADLGVVVWADSVTSTLRHIKVAKSKNFMRMGTPGIVRKEFLPECASYRFLGKGI